MHLIVAGEQMKTLTFVLFIFQSFALVFGQTEQKLELVVQSGHSESITSVDFSPNGKIIAYGILDNKIKLWSIESGREIRILAGHIGGVKSVVFSSDGKILVSNAVVDRTIRLWSVETGEELKTFAGPASSISFNPDGKILASGSGKIIKLWNVETGQQFKIFNDPKT